MNFYKILCLFLVLSTTTSCFEDADDNGAHASEINDFVWKGLNAFYLYKEEIPNLADDRFNSSDEYANYLNNFEQPEVLFESLVYNRDEIDKFSVIVDNYIELQQFLNGTSLSNGIEYGLSYIPNSSYEIFGVVRYVHPNSTADINNIKRGDIFLGINGVVLNIDNYNNLLSLDNYEVNLADYLDNGTETLSDDTIEFNNINVELSKQAIAKNPIYFQGIINLSLIHI